MSYEGVYTASQVAELVRWAADQVRYDLGSQLERERQDHESTRRRGERYYNGMTDAKNALEGDTEWSAEQWMDSASSAIQIMDRAKGLR